jgi:hypothetical protein
MRHLALLAAVGCGSSSGATADAGADAPAAPRPVPQLVATEQRCKLLNARNVSDPTANDVQHRANVLGADLGIFVEHADTLYVMFGDTIGYAGIWGNESHPDAVGYGADPAAAIAANPSLLCNGLRVITLPPESSVGPTVDPTVVADFAGVAMTPPPGHAIGEYIRNPAGGTFENLPGDFEVPSGAFAHAGSIYVFYTTVVGPSDITMKQSYLARWSVPSPTAIPAYDILYTVDQRFDANGPLGGHFTNIAAAPHGEHVYLFGTGEFRASPVHLARHRLDALAAPGIELFDPATGTWSQDAARTAPVFGPAGYGETSVRYFASIDRWMFVAEELTASSNRIVARFADRAEGPWSDAIVVHDMADPDFRQAHCCAETDNCQGTQFLHCDRTGFYGAYLLPDVIAHADGSFTATYSLSSFDPYNVALFSATFR